jgi:hypothetical protein
MVSSNQTHTHTHGWVRTGTNVCVQFEVAIQLAKQSAVIGRRHGTPSSTQEVSLPMQPG